MSRRLRVRQILSQNTRTAGPLQRIRSGLRPDLSFDQQRKSSPMHSGLRISGEEGDRTYHRPGTPSPRTPGVRQDRIVLTSILLVATTRQRRQVFLRVVLSLSSDKNEQRTAARPSRSEERRVGKECRS